MVELLVAIAIVAVLIVLLMGVTARSRSSLSAVSCCSNLRQIAAAFQAYSNDHQRRLPNPPLSGISWETALKQRLATGVLRCPGDEEMFPALGSSYDWRDTGNPRTTLAGRIIDEARTDAVLAFEMLPGWHAKRMINVVRVDGSATILEEADRLRDLERSPMRYWPLEDQTEQEK